MQRDIRPILTYVVRNYTDHLDSLGDINLTSLEEDVMDTFEFTDQEFEDADVSFRIWAILVERGIIPNN